MIQGKGKTAGIIGLFPHSRRPTPAGLSEICEPAIFQLVLLAQRLRITHILQRRSYVYRRIVGWVAGHIPGLHHATGRSGWGRAERKESTQASGIHLLEERLRHPFKTGRRVPANPGTRRLPFFTSLPMERLSCP
jgi:hypothetical protein